MAVSYTHLDVYKRQVENLLSVTRIENGSMNIHETPELLEEVVQEALRHINRKKAEHRITFEQEDDLLMARMDSRLVIQVCLLYTSRCV